MVAPVASLVSCEEDDVVTLSAVGGINANVLTLKIPFNVKSCCLVKTVRGCIGQLTDVVTELQVMEDQDEVHDSLLATKDAKLGEESKLSALNDVIAEALADIETLQTDV
ncbi:hypothetical protein Tco_0630237 [Tanacetum coccineum]